MQPERFHFFTNRIIMKPQKAFYGARKLAVIEGPPDTHHLQHPPPHQQPESFGNRLARLLLKDNISSSSPSSIVDGNVPVAAPMPYYIHLLMLPMNVIELDGLTTMELIYNAFIEGFDLTDDIVAVEFEHASNNPQSQHCVSVTYDNEWRCQIMLNDNIWQVQREAQQWSQQYATELPMGERLRIGTCTRRLDIMTDPDPHRDYFDDFIALIDHLRLTLAPCYIFDKRHNEFLQ
jgi:hypothetical protein